MHPISDPKFASQCLMPGKVSPVPYDQILHIWYSGKNPG